MRAMVVLTALLVLAGCSNPSSSTKAPASAGAQPAAGWLEDYEQAQAKAKETGKPVLVNFTGSDWCSWCVKLEGEVFSQPEFERWAAEKVVLLKVDFPQHTPQAEEQKRKNHALAKRYGVQGFPTLLILDESGKALGKLGYVPGGPEAWIARADAALAN